MFLTLAEHNYVPTCSNVDDKNRINARETGIKYTHFFLGLFFFFFFFPRGGGGGSLFSLFFLFLLLLLLFCTDCQPTRVESCGWRPNLRGCLPVLLKSGFLWSKTRSSAKYATKMIIIISCYQTDLRLNTRFPPYAILAEIHLFLPTSLIFLMSTRLIPSRSHLSYSSHQAQPMRPVKKREC